MNVRTIAFCLLALGGLPVTGRVAASDENDDTHWAFRPLRDVTPPPVANPSWARTPVDRFVLAALETRELAPSPVASPHTLIRRICLDVTGLPPTPKEASAFEAAWRDNPDTALSALVDRLLDTRHYAERWGRHWLDVARYADSDGQEADRDRPNAYHYRDFVIRSIHDDMPFDRFVRWQLAGDEYEPASVEAVAATGFLVAGPNTVLADTFLEEERLRNRYNELDDVVSTIGTALLGVTVGCARCHDHKFDDFSSRDYYRLLAAVHSGDRAEVDVASAESGAPRKTKVLAFRDRSAEPARTWLFERADFRDRDEPVTLGFPAALSRGRSAEDYREETLRTLDGEIEKVASTYQRRALAEWITDVEHGAGALVARVIVNRVWKHHFGAGLSRTPNDFGVRGERPSHPDLLEWLARDLVRGDWKLKRVHRRILTSAAYLQAATFNAQKASVDPENRLLWRMRPRRLEAEILRDAMLAVAGTLNLEPYGPGFKPPVAQEAMLARNLQGTKYPQDAKDEPATRRRSVYMFHKRLIPFPLLQAFDWPDSLQSCGLRVNTTVAPQALAILNDAFVRARAFEFADRLLQELGESGMPETALEPLVRRAFQLALARAPSERDLAASTAFIERGTRRRAERASGRREARRVAVADFCHSIFGLNEFLWVD